MYRPVLSCKGLLAMYLLKGAPRAITPLMNKETKNLQAQLLRQD